MGTTLRNDTLVCTKCDEVVTLDSGYDGFIAECACPFNSMAMRAGSGDKPRSWERAEKLTQLKAFRFDGGEWGENGMEGQVAMCKRCNTKADVTFKDVNVGDFKRKATLRCENEHGSTGYVNTDTIYCDMGEYTSDFWK